MPITTDNEAAAHAANEAAQVARKAQLDAFTAKRILASETPTTSVSSDDVLSAVDAQTGASIFIPIGSVGGDSVTSSDIDIIVKLTQAAYDALGTPNARTLYVIVG